MASICKSNNYTSFFISGVLFLLTFCTTARPIKIMLVTGGHSYDTVSFFNMFDKMKGITYTHFQQPGANAVLTGNDPENYDVIVFYDMWKTISEPEKMAYIELTKQGIPLLFLHHSLASYQDWPEFEKIIGGKYIEKKSSSENEPSSTYQHDVWVDVEVLPQNKITKGIRNFRIFDEVYGNFRVLPNIKPLLKTNHPKSSSNIGWINQYNNSNIVYLQSGHDRRAYENENYIKLVLSSIRFLSKNKGLK